MAEDIPKRSRTNDWLAAINWGFFLRGIKQISQRQELCRTIWSGKSDLIYLPLKAYD
jgi:hypothetical protein